jgi:hypothetical protein
MSGYTDSFVTQTIGVDTSVAFLQKPFSPEVLVRTVRGVLDA